MTAWCSWVVRACPGFTMWLCDAVLVKYQYFTLARHPFDAKTYQVLLLRKDSLLIFEQFFSYYTWFGRSSRLLNFDKFRDTAPLTELCKMALFLRLFAICKILPPKLKLSMCINDFLLSRAVAVQTLFILRHEKLRSIRHQSVNITLNNPVQILFILWHEKLRSIRYQSVNITLSVPVQTLFILWHEKLRSIRYQSVNITLSVPVQTLFILWHEKLRSIRYQSVNITLSVPVQTLFILWHEKLRSIRYQSVNITLSVPVQTLFILWHGIRVWT